MRKYISILVCLFLFSTLRAQYKVRFVLKEKTAIHHDSIYITGTFSNWDSTANANYLLKQYRGNEKSIVLTLNPGVMRYKFHRGSWFTVEKKYDGNEVDDRIVNITKDTTLMDSVLSWRDQTLADKKYSLTAPLPDSVRIATLTAIANNYSFLAEYYNTDSALHYAQKGLMLLQSIKSSGKKEAMPDGAYSRQLINLQHIIAALMYSLGNYSKALELDLDNLSIGNKLNDKVVMANNLNYIIGDYLNIKDYQRALAYGRQMDSTISDAQGYDAATLVSLKWLAKYQIANAYYGLKLTDSALLYAQKISAYKFPGSADYHTHLEAGLLADIYSAKGLNDSALYYYRQAIPYFEKMGVIPTEAILYTGIARVFKNERRLDSALFYARNALDLLQNNKRAVQSWGDNSESYITEISPLVAELYKAYNQPDSAYKYLLLSVSLKDSLYNSDRVRQFQTLTFNEDARRQQLEQQRIEAEKEYSTKIKMYGLFSIIAGILIVAFLLYRNNKHKQKANILLLEQKKTVENTLQELKATQQQLIQSEKMASLGELTAGIAHEIQNPLNFVNNFSEVNQEMVDELQTELKSGNVEEAIAISNDIKDNSEKINHHGKRADAIVKGMLQHSRTSTGQKEPTDINALADEYLRLSYHGMRAKSKNFNATIQTDFDESIGKINIVPQDIGRVLLNLYNNAFFAVNEKKTPAPKGEKNTVQIDYEPRVTVSTKSVKSPSGNLGVILTVKDNGNGIPQKVLDKIFQPFFTTKPTGEGTGLGLSLSYDIVKAHSGEIKVETKEGEGSEFIIQLPF